MQINPKYMITTREIIRILEHEELPDEERDNLEILLQERAQEALEKYAKGKTVVIRLATDIESLVDYIDLSEKMRDADSDDIEELVSELIDEKVEELSGPNGWREHEIESE